MKTLLLTAYLLLVTLAPAAQRVAVLTPSGTEVITQAEAQRQLKVETNPRRILALEVALGIPPRNPKDPGPSVPSLKTDERGVRQ